MMNRNFEKYMKSTINTIKLAKTIQSFCNDIPTTVLLADGDCDMRSTGSRYDSHWVSSKAKNHQKLTALIFRQILGLPKVLLNVFSQQLHQILCRYYDYAGFIFIL